MTREKGCRHTELSSVETRHVVVLLEFKQLFHLIVSTVVMTRTSGTQWCRQAGKQSLRERPDGSPFAHPALMSVTSNQARRQSGYDASLSLPRSRDGMLALTNVLVLTSCHTFIYDAASTVADKLCFFKNNVLGRLPVST
jgi:hypothetical protein